MLGTLGNFILIGDSLVSAERVALKGARDCAPYLFELPYELHKLVFNNILLYVDFKLNDVSFEEKTISLAINVFLKSSFFENSYVFFVTVAINIVDTREYSNF